MGARGEYDHLTYDELRNPCRTRGFAREDSKAALKARLATMDAVERERGREREDVMDTREVLLATRRTRHRVEDLQLASVAHREVVKKNMRSSGAPSWRRLRADAAISVWGRMP